MRNFIGGFLIALAAFLSFLRNMIFFVLTVGIVGGIFIITMFSLFELFGRVSPQDFPMEIVLFKKPIWDVVVVVLGGATMWLGIKKMFESDEADSKVRTKDKEYLF